MKEGITKTDFYLANWLRKKNAERNQAATLIESDKKNQSSNLKTLLVANKSEYENDGDIYFDIYKLGFGEPIFVSAEQGDGFQDLLQVIEEMIPDETKEEYQKKIKKRKEKFLKLKEKLKKEIREAEKENRAKEDEGLKLH